MGIVSEQEALAPEYYEGAPRRRAGLFWLSLITLAAVCLFVLMRSDAFRLTGVTVGGNSHVPTDRLMHMAGVETGSYRWLNSASAIAQRVKAEPWVADAQVEWRGNQLFVDVTERKPVGLLPYRGVYVAIDAEGIILEQVGAPVEYGLPVVGGIETTRALRGERLGHQGLTDALEVLAFMEHPEALPVRNQISEVFVHPDRSLDLYMRSGATVYFGAVDLDKRRMVTVASRVSSLKGYWKTVSGRLPAGCEIDLRVENQVRPSGKCS